MDNMTTSTLGSILALFLATLLYPLYFLYINNHDRQQIQYTYSNLTNCTFDAPHCFDWSSCTHSTAIYIYPPSASSWFIRSYKHWFSNTDDLHKYDRRIDHALRSDPTLTITSNPHKACLFVPPIACLSVNRCAVPRIFAGPALRQLPYWNTHGRNHVVLDHGDDPFAYVSSGTVDGITGAEIRIRSASSTQYHRPGFDIGLSLRPKLSVYSTVARGGGTHQSSRRPLLLGFLGAPTTRSKLRRRLSALHDANKNIDVTVRPPKCPVPCPRHSPEYYDEYRSILLRSKFQLVPRGQGLHSHRLLEALASGSVPIVLADGIVLPFAELIPWHKAIIQVPEKEWSLVPSIALAHLNQVQEMQCAGLTIYRHFFLRPHGTISLALRLLQRNIRSKKFFKGKKKHVPLLTPWPIGTPKPASPSFCTSSLRAQEIEEIVETLIRGTVQPRHVPV